MAKKTAKKKTAKKPNKLTELVELYRFGIGADYSLEHDGDFLGTIPASWIHARIGVPCRKYRAVKARLTIEFLPDKKKK